MASTSLFPCSCLNSEGDIAVISVLGGMFVSPQHSYIETLLPSVMVLEDRASEKWLG